MKLWLCRRCGRLLSPLARADAPEHTHPLTGLVPQMGGIVRQGDRVWRMAGWGPGPVLWAMACDGSGVDLDRGYRVEEVPVGAWERTIKAPKGLEAVQVGLFR